MRDVNENTITNAVLATIEGADNPRTAEILISLIKHLHSFVRDVNLSSEEWRRSMALLMDAANISDDERSEFILFSDTLGVSSLVDMMGVAAAGSTEASVLGPFYVEGAPELGFGPDMIKDNTGTRIVVQGTVSDSGGKPIPGAVLDIWQNADNGLYQVQDPDQSDDNLRCRTVSNEGASIFSPVLNPYLISSPMTVLWGICCAPRTAIRGGPGISTSRLRRKDTSRWSLNCFPTTTPIWTKTPCLVFGNLSS